MTNSSLTVVAAAVAGMVGVMVSPPGLAKSPKHVRYTAPLPAVVVPLNRPPIDHGWPQWLLGYDNVELLGR